MLKLSPVLLFAVLSWACGGDGGTHEADVFTPDAGEPTGTEFDEWCAAVSTIWIGLAGRCRDPSANPFPVEDLCADPKAAIDAGRVTYNAEEASRCLAALPGDSCKVFEYGLPTVCFGVVTGTVDVGSSCFSDSLGVLGYLLAGSECRAGYCPAVDSCRSACTAHVETGGACTHPESCGRLSYCNSDGVCTQRAALGESCGRRPCADGLVCSRSPGDQTGICEEGRSDGDPCGSEGGCPSSLLCVDGLCSRETALGQPCVSDGQCTDGYCDRPAEGAGECVAEKGVGEMCRIYSCEDGLACIQRTCTDRIDLAEGEACDATSRCAEGLHCWDGACRGQAGAGTACGVSWHCEEGLFCGTDSTCQLPRGLGESCTTESASACEAGLGCTCTAADCTTPPDPPSPDLTCQPLKEDGVMCWNRTECIGTCSSANICRPRQCNGR